MDRFLRPTVLVALAFCSQIFYVSAQTQLAAWTFDVASAQPNTPTSPAANLGAQSGTAALYADGTNGSSTWLQASELNMFAGSTSNDPRGSPVAGSSFAIVNSSANSKAIVIKFSMTGFKDPALSFVTQRTGTGFNNHTWAWSTDGSAFTNFGTNTSIPSAFGLESYDLSSVNTLDNAATVFLRLTVTGASSASGNNRLDNIVVNATNASPPNFTVNYPKTQNISSTGFQGTVNLDKTGTAYCVVVPDGSTAPTSAQVKAGQDGLGNTLAANFIASVSVTSSATDFSFNITGLASSTAYDVYFVADNSDGIQAAPVKIDVTTLSASDVNPPNFTSSYPKVNSILATAFTVRTNLDELGKTYFVVLANNASAPTSLQVKNGQDGNGTTLSVGLIGTINVPSATAEFSATVNGLSPVTSYDIYFVAEDNIPNLQTSPTKVSVTTSTLYTESFNNCDGTASFTSYSVTGDQVWGCVDFGYNGTKGLRMNGFLGSAVDNEDWLISPVLMLSANANLSFYSQFSFAGPALQLKISSDYTGSGNPNAATWTPLNGNFPTVAVGSSSTALSDWTLSNVDLSAYSGNVYVAFVYTSTTGTNTAARWTLDEINFSGAVASYLSVVPSGLLFNSSGAVKSYILKGINLQNDVNITAPANFLVSKDNTTFGASISYTATQANAQQTVYAQFSTGSPSTNIFTGSISHTSTGVATKNVAVTGTDKSLTLDIVAYNLEFFGTDVRDNTGVEFGPTDDALQVSNVTTVLQTIQSDIFGVEEISDDNAFSNLVAGLPGYAGIVSNRWSHSTDPPDPFFPPQKVGFVYNTSTVQLIGSRVMFAKLYDDIIAGTVTLPAYPTGTSSSFWSSGRLPFMATFDVTINGTKRRIRMIDIHAKSSGSSTAQEDYNRRKYDAQVLYDSLTAHYSHDNIILLGDFNDDVDVSIFNNSLSPYKIFVDDVANFNVITYPLSLTGASSFPSSTSLIDQILVSNELTTSYVNNSAAIEDPRNYISNYSNTTSDHLPVSARFLFSGKADQFITFGPLPPKTFGDAPLTVAATAYSGLPVTFASSDPSVASVSGNTITILKAGAVNITASQVGDSYYNSAVDVVQPLVINKIGQTISFNAISAKTFGALPFGLTATSSSGLSVTYVSSNTTVATISGTSITIAGAGTTTITASQAGNSNYNAASDVPQVLTVNKSTQTITFSTLTDKTVGDAAFSLTATSSSSLAVNFATASDKITIATNQVTIVKAGRTVITASQGGNTNFSAAASVDQSFCIKPSKPTVTTSNGNTTTPTLSSSAPAGNQWYLNGTAISGAVNSTLNVTTAGVYKVQVTVDDCASDFSADATLVFTGDLSSPQAQLLVYPNPVENYFEISGLKEQVVGSQLYDMTGRMSTIVLEKKGEIYRAPVENLAPGVYLLRVQDEIAVHQVKFIKK